MRIGVHPTPTRPHAPPLPLHIEAVAWFAPAIPPATRRTVIVRIAGQAGAPEAFHDGRSGRWFSMLDGCEISEPIEAWAERPAGPGAAAQQQSSSAVVARLAKRGTLGLSLRLTDVGKQLVDGDYELQLVATPTTRSPT